MNLSQPTTLAAALALAFTTLAVQAQTVPKIGDVLRQAQPPAVPAAQPAALPAFGGAPIAPPMQSLPGGGSAVQVQVFSVVGNRVIDSATLLALVQPEQGKALSLAELDAIATRITRHYRSAGYFVARAYIPAQELKDGTLTIRVVEGNYGQFHLKNQSRVRNAIVQGLLDDIKDRDIVSLDTLERAMLIINDAPGVKVVQADVMPGQKVGTSDFAITTEATAAYKGYVMLDNYGSIYTGKDRLSFNADWNSPTGRGDRLSLSGLATQDGGLLNGRLAYSALAATNGTRAEAALSRTHYQLGDTYSALEASGTATALDLGLKTPLKRTRNHSVEAGVTLSVKDLKDDVASTATATGKKAVSVSANVSSKRENQWLGFDGLTQASAAVTVGHLQFNDAAAAALDAAGANTQGNYARLNLAIARVTLLPQQFSLSTSVRAQWALNGKNMDGSERMSIAGDGGVAAYPSGELSGDDAALVRVELSHALPSVGAVQFGANAFADYGWARAAKPLAGAGGRGLSDVGVAVTANAAGALFKISLAHRVNGGAPSSEPAPRTRVLIQGGWVF